MNWILLLVCSLLPFVTSIFYFLPTAPSPSFMLILSLTKFFLFAAPFLFWKSFQLPGNWKDFALLFKFTGRQLKVGILLGLLMVASIEGTFLFISPETRSEGLRRIALKISVLGIKEHFWLYGIVLSFVHSLLEEFYWRFFLFQAWRKKLPRFAAHFVAGLAFSLHHFVVTIHYFDFSFGMVLGFGVFAGALIWSMTFEKERSLLGVWICHILADLALISIGMRALA